MTPTPSRPRPITKLRELRLNQGLTQIQLAVRAGLSLSTVKKVETSESPDELRLVYTQTWVQLARELGCRVADIYPRLGI